MKKFLLSAAVVATLFTACKKDDKATTNNYIKIGSETIKLAAATDGMNNSVKGVVFYSIDPYDILTYSGKITTAALSIDTLAEGTYTFRSSFSDDYQVSKNFSGFVILANFSYSSTTGNQTGGTSYAYPDTGTVIIKRSGTNYNFTYDLKYDTVVVTGQYTGALEK
jgi:hypothetical protein